MKVQEFINNLSSQNFNGGLSITEYIPYDEKMNIIDAIMFDCIQEYEGYYTIDTPLMDKLFIKYMIETHTDLELDDSSYDDLRIYIVEGESLLSFVMNLFSTDYKETYSLLLKKVEDYKINNNPLNIFARIIFNIENVLVESSSTIEENINKINFDKFFPNGITEEGMKNFLNKCGDV